MQSFDPIYLQRLVDGELSRPDTRKLLEMAESNPHLWREMASAFVENQIWQTDFDQLNHDETIAIAKSAVSSKEPARAGVQGKTKIPIWFSLAAGILLALTTGLLVGRYGEGLLFNHGNPIVKNNDAVPGDKVLVQSPKTDKPGERTLVDYQPDYHLEFEDANGNPYFGSEIPLYRASKAEQAGIDVNQPSLIPIEFVERAGRRGYGVKQDLNFISGRLSDGRQFVVPVRTINLSPGQ